MQMVSGGQLSGVPYKGDRGACRHLVTYFLQKLFIMLVYGDNVTVVLYLYSVPGFIAPSGKDYCSVQCGLDYLSCRCGDVYIRMYRCIISL